MNLYTGRKHLGPLDIAQINAIKNRESLQKSATLQSIMKDIKEAEDELEKKDLQPTEKVMLQMLKSQLEHHLYEFLGVPYDSRTPEDS